ncbi:MAG: hypothetical protein WC830_10135 [Burkholderiales bacterium]|jgi:hypothetical protein
MVRRAASKPAGTAGEQRQWHFGGPGRAPVTLNQIRGEAFISMDLVWPAIVWNEGRCWVHLHDLAPAALQRIMEALRNTELERSAPHGPLNWG